MRCGKLAAVGRGAHQKNGNLSSKSDLSAVDARAKFSLRLAIVLSYISSLNASRRVACRCRAHGQLPLLLSGASAVSGDNIDNVGKNNKKYKLKSDNDNRPSPIIDEYFGDRV